MEGEDRLAFSQKNSSKLCSWVSQKSLPQGSGNFEGFLDSERSLEQQKRASRVLKLGKISLSLF